jgi:transposase
MPKRPKGRWTKECREQAVTRVLEEGLSLREAGNRRSLPWKTLQHGVAAARADTLGDVGSQRRPLTDLEAELARIQRELAEVKLERDLLINAAVYVAKASQPGTRR